MGRRRDESGGWQVNDQYVSRVNRAVLPLTLSLSPAENHGGEGTDGTPCHGICFLRLSQKCARSRSERDIFVQIARVLANAPSA